MNKQSANRKHELANTLAAYKYWLLVSIGVFMLGAFAYQILHKPVYTVSTMLRLDNTQKKNPTTQPVFKSPANSALSSAIVKLLRSESMIKKADSASNSNVADEETNHDLLVSTGKDSSTWMLSLITEHPRQGKYFLQQLINLASKEYYRTIIMKSFNDSLSMISATIAAKSKESKRLKNEIVQNGGYNAAMTGEDQKQKDILKAIKPYLNNADRQYQLIPTAFPIKDAYINNLVLQFNDAQSDKQHQLSENPDKTLVAAANNKITLLQHALQKVIDSTERSSIKTTSSSTNTSGKIKLTDSLLKIERGINDKINLYAGILQRKLQFEYIHLKGKTNHGHVNTFQVIEVGYSPFSFYFTALLCGLLLPLAIVSLFFQSNSDTSHTNDVEEIPVLGGFASTTYKGLAEVTGKIANSLATGKKVILITSVNNVADKAAISGKIALHLSKSNARVVIIDLDFNDYKHIDSPAPTYAGLTDFIFSSSTPLEDIIIKTQYLGVSMITKGTEALNGQDYMSMNTILPGSADEDQKDVILNSPRFVLMIESLAQKFDYILLNATPLNAPADVLPLNRFSTVNVVILSGSENLKKQREYLQQMVVKYSIKGTYVIINE